MDRMNLRAFKWRSRIGEHDSAFRKFTDQPLRKRGAIAHMPSKNSTRLLIKRAVFRNGASIVRAPSTLEALR